MRRKPAKTDICQVQIRHPTFSSPKYSNPARPTSAFVETFECIAMRPDTSLTILGRVLRNTGPDGVEKRLIASPIEMTAILARDFGITNAPIHRVWPRILARHGRLFGSEDAIPN